MKTAIVIMSDPHSNSDEALGRVFNGLAVAHEYKQSGEEVRIVFQGTGTRWTSELTKSDHPANALYTAVQDTVAGVSSGCADAFGAADAARENGFEILKDNPVPGTSGLTSLKTLIDGGYNILIF